MAAKYVVIRVKPVSGYDGVDATMGYAYKELYAACPPVRSLYPSMCQPFLGRESAIQTNFTFKAP